MFKNQADQSIGAQLIRVDNGDPFVDQARVSITIDNGIQFIGSGTAPVHEGQGYHSYRPLQSETNGDHLAFTFDDVSGEAIVFTAQVYTDDPSSGTIIIPGTGQACDTVWKATLVPLLRVIIGDFTDPPTYSDDRLCQLLGAAAFFVAGDLCDCPNLTFTYDVVTGVASPDPLSNAVIANLIVLRAACILDQGLTRSRSISEGFKAVCGPASLQVLSASSTFSSLFENGPCAAYLDLKEACCFRNLIQSAEFCKFVLGPFVSECYVPCRDTRTDDCCGILSAGSAGNRAGGGGNCCN